MTEDDAKKRFFFLTFLRFSGLAIAMLGVAIIAKRLVEPAEILGYTLIAVGVIDVIVVPQLLVRAWKNADKG
ncbi:hypothetical protein SPAN111604_08170 [Sphingomonas antarctica]|uniref:hypothetical protein n=1 Tax=Sphingomonas antarctica TaxID=2040274 RepID=UPI0039ECFBE3